MIKKAIISGAGGFLGSRLSEALVNHGIFVYALDCTFQHNETSSTTSAVSSGADNISSSNKLLRRYKCDLEKNILPSDHDLHNADILFHFAWDGSHPDHRNDYELQIKNISSLLNILSFAKRANVNKTIIPGSAGEYAASRMPITGGNTPGAVDAYGAVKSACHVISQAWSKQNNLPLIWVVPSSVYGPGRNDNNALTYAIKTLLKGEKPSFTALEQKWDYIYIDDFIEAFFLLAQKGIAGKNYALGCGASKKLLDYITLIRDLINPDLQLGIGEKPYKYGKPDNSEIDIFELQNDTGFTAKVTFEEGIRKTIKWYSDNYDNI